MKVIVQCPKGHRFRCDDHLLGRHAKCPRAKCGVRFVLEQVEHAADQAAPSAACRSCGAPTPEAAVICTSCGSDPRTGTQRVMPADDYERFARAARARGIDVERYRPPARGRAIGKMFAYFGSAAACLVVGFVIEPPEVSFRRGLKGLIIEHFDIFLIIFGVALGAIGIFGLVRLITTGRTGLDELEEEMMRDG